VTECVWEELALTVVCQSAIDTFHILSSLSFTFPFCTLVVFVTLCLSVTLFLGPSLLSLTLSLRPSPFVIQGSCSNQVLLSNNRWTVLTHLVCRFITAIRLD